MTDTRFPSKAQRTALWGGIGVMLATLYPFYRSLPLSVTEMDAALMGNQILPLVSSAILGVAFGILAFGLQGESGIAGTSTAGVSLLFVFGIHPFILDVGGLLTPSFTEANAGIGGWADLSVRIVGVCAALIASIIIVRVGILRGYARWALVMVAVANAFELMLSLLAAVEIVPLLIVIYLASWALLFVAGASYAVHGQWSRIRKTVAFINSKW